MMEIVYKDDTKTTKEKSLDALPKNIRQIGGPDNRLRVYLEDFACTYLQKTVGYQPEKTRLCILCGEERKIQGQSVLFVKSVARLREARIQADGMLAQPDWREAESIRRKHFPEQEILGWVVMPGSQEPVHLEQIKTLHRHHFTGGKKLLLWWETGEKEELLFGAGAEELINLNGYYIYYEENRSMREYMIEHNPGAKDRVGEPDDRAVKDFRRVVERKQHTDPGTAGQLVRIAAAACVVFALAGVLRYVRDTESSLTAKSTAVALGEQWESSVEETKASVFSATADQETIEETETKLLTDTASAAAAETGADTDTEDEILKTEETVEMPDTTADEEAALSLEETNTLGYTAYQVKAGDTISNISQSYYGTMSRVEEICALNHIDEQDLIYTGQILLLPQ